jgi:hypothetical protein
MVRTRLSWDATSVDAELQFMDDVVARVVDASHNDPSDSVIYARLVSAIVIRWGLWQDSRPQVEGLQRDEAAHRHSDRRHLGSSVDPARASTPYPSSRETTVGRASPWERVVNDQFDSGGVPGHSGKYDRPYGSARRTAPGRATPSSRTARCAWSCATGRPVTAARARTPPE